jgi:hypothetical protein
MKGKGKDVNTTYLGQRRGFRGLFNRLWDRRMRRGRNSAAYYSFSTSEDKLLNPADRVVVKDDGFVAPEVIRGLRISGLRKRSPDGEHGDPPSPEGAV